MSRFYTNVIQTKSKIIHYYIEDGKRKVERVNFKPSLGITTKKSEGITDIYGNNIGMIKFESFGEFHHWKKENSDYIDIYNDIQPKYQFIAEKYPQKIKPEFDKVRTDIWDIECNSIDGDESLGFPNPEEALLPITAITVMDYYENEFFVFGFKEDYIPETDNIIYFYCEDEFDLLTKFLSLVRKRRPDIISGWNVEGFDIPYIINRMKILLAKDEFLKLSPLNDIKQSKLENDRLGYKIIGIAILDYLKVYKKLSIKKSENYKLDTILEKEIKRNKVQYQDEYDNLTDLYNRNFKKFIDYNIYDCQGIGEMNDKIRFFEVLMMMAYEAKASYEDVFGTVGIWDVNLYNLFKNNNIVHSPKKVHHREPFPGGYVKEPIPGFYKNVSVADITSSYPNQIISGNMSPETLVPYDKLPPSLKDLSLKVKRLDWKNDPDAYLDFDLINEHTEEMVKHNICMLANGEFFRTDKEGLFPKIVSEIFQRRKKRKKEAGQYKTKLKDLKKQNGNPEEIKKLEKLFAYADAEQYALKIQINSFYGCFSSPYFRYFEIKMAAATTITGQQCVKGPERYVTTKYKDVKHIGGDTDSCFFTYDTIINKRFPNGYTMEESREFIKTFNKTAIVPTINEFYKDMCKSLNFRKNTYNMEFEIIADTAILVAKKRYVMNKIYEDGYDYNKEDGVQLKITGIDIVRSNTPMIVRDKLKELVTLMLTSANNDSCIDFIESFRKQFFKLRIDQVARPTGVNGVKKYKLGDKSVPINVRAALIYNKALKDYKLKHLPPIGEGEKIKYCYVKEPNIHSSNVIGFIGEMPEELMKTIEVDYELQFEKTVIAPIKHMFDAVKWATEQNTNLSEWF